MKDDILSMSKQVGLSVDDTEKAFQELKRKGYFFTYAKTADDIASRKFPIRGVGMPPNDPDEPSIISFGPFAVERKRYEQIRDTLGQTHPGEFKILLGYYRLMYEKTGTQKLDYKFTTKTDLPESEYMILSTIESWDIDNPIVYDEFVWFVPKNEVKEMIEKSNNIKFSKNDFSWWNYKYDLGTEIELSTFSDYPELYHLIPTDFTDLWGIYLSKLAFSTMYFLYHEMLAGGESKTIDSLQEMLILIEEGISKYISVKEDNEKYNTAVDRELLIKELYDYNSITYPIDTPTILNCLQQVGLISVNQEKTRIKYQIPQITPKPKKVFKFPKNWHKRMDEYIEKGTILFSYLTINEIVQ